VDVVRIGFIGVGGVAGGHLNYLKDFEDVELTALCDINADLLAQRAENFGVEDTYSDYKQMLDKAELDAVYVCVPPFAHGSIEEDVVATGTPIFIEKPVHLDMEPAIKKYETIRDSGVINAVGYCVRYLDTVATLKDRLADHKVEMALGYYMGGAPGGWWQQRDKSGGQLVEQTTHIVDTALYVVGDVKAVGGGFVTRTPINDTSTVDNMSQAHLYFENGAIGTITSACSLSQGFKTGLDIFARDLVVEFNYGAMKIRGTDDTFEQETGNNMYASEGRAFVDAVKSGDPSSILCDYGEGLKTLEVTLLAYEAFQQQTVLETTFKPSE